MMIKYRVHEVAKDLKVPSKEIIDLLAKYYDEPRKHMTALSEEELNIIFDHYTKAKSVENFDSYFAMAKEEKPSEPAAEKKVPASEPVVAAAPQKQAEKKEPLKENNTQAHQPQPKQSNTQQPNMQQRPQGGQQQGGQQQGQQRPQQRPFQQRPAQGQATQQQRQPQQGARPQQRPQGQQQGQQRPQQPRPQGNRPQPNVQPRPKQERYNPLERSYRHVDTRGANVELDKYNEHYEEIAPDRAKKDTFIGKQKIKQKSNDRRPYYSKKESEAEKLRKLQLEKQKKVQLKVSIPDEISVGELAARLKVTASAVIKKLMQSGVMASISDNIDYDTAALMALDFGAKVEKEIEVTIEDKLIDDSEDKDENLKPRSPIVVVMGHVDHGKTSILDAIRKSDVASHEAGGITQRIGAYRVSIKGKEITFLDTPGHEAFTSMRARGAQVTDIAVLVVAADDGIMPQTIEAINHAKAANVAIIVAINKIDKPGANPERVKQELTEHGLVPEEWGGETICVPVSAVTHENLDQLLEMILLVAEMKDLKANPDRAAKGTVIEARLDKGRGPIATMLIQNGTLHTGDVIIAGTTVGRVRAMADERGKRVNDAGPSVPVEITGLSEVPSAGDIFHAVKDEKMARELVEQRRHQEKEEQFNSYQKVTLDNLFSQMQQGEMKELGLIIKADVQGSVEAVCQSLEKLSNEEIRVKMIHGGVGAINESDVQLAIASNAIIIGFNVRPDADAHKNAELAGVEIRMYRIIYDCIEEIKAAMKGMLAPKTREVQLGRIEVRQVYRISSVGTIAGCYVLEGKVARNAMIRLVRDGIVITEDTISSLKRFKDDAKEVMQGYECGIGLEKYNDIKAGDIFESYTIEEYRE